MDVKHFLLTSKTKNYTFIHQKLSTLLQHNPTLPPNSPRWKLATIDFCKQMHGMLTAVNNTCSELQHLWQAFALSKSEATAVNTTFSELQHLWQAFALSKSEA